MPLLIFILIVLCPSFAQAAELRAGETWALATGEILNDDLYAAGGSIGIGGTVRGDVIGAGGTVNITGIVDADVIAAGGTVNVAGQVGDDVRVAGGTVTLSGKVVGDVVVAGGTVKMLPGTLVGGDVIANGGEVIIDGAITGSVRANGNVIRLDGLVAGPVNANAGKISMGSRARLQGGLSYSAPREVAMAQGAQVIGPTRFQRASDGGDGTAADFLGAWFFLRLVLALVSGVIAVWLFRNVSRRLVRDSLSHPGHELLRGFVLLIMVPVTLVLLFVTVVGLPLGFIGALLYAAFLIIANIYAGILLGSWLWKRIRKQAQYDITIPAAIAGIFLLWAVSWIPIVGWLLQFGLMLMAFGAIFHLLYVSVRPIPQRPA